MSKSGMYYKIKILGAFKMLLLQIFDKLNIKLSESVSIYDMNIKTCPLYVGLLGACTF